MTASAKYLSSDHSAHVSCMPYTPYHPLHNFWSSFTYLNRSRSSLLALPLISLDRSLLRSHFEDVISLPRQTRLLTCNNFPRPSHSDGLPPDTSPYSLSSFFAQENVQLAPVDAFPQPETDLPLPFADSIHTPVPSMLQRSLFLPPSLSLHIKLQVLLRNFRSSLQRPLQALPVSLFVSQALQNSSPKTYA